MARLQLSKEELEEYKARARTSPWLAYPLTAVPAVLPWHESDALYRVLSSGNGTGKSTAGAADLVSYAMGYNPIRKETYNTPNVCWGVCVDYTTSGRVMYRKIWDMLPKTPSGTPTFTWHKQEHIFTLKNGSIIQIKSQKEGESSLLAERCRAIWVDEAMGGERGEENFGELQARGLPDEPLNMLFTLTPKVDIGLEWMNRKLWHEAGRGDPHEEFIPGTYCLRFTMEDCLIENGGFLDRAFLEKKRREVADEEQGSRIDGEWVPFVTRPAFSMKMLLKALERAPIQMPAWFRPGSINRSHLEVKDGGPCRLQRERESGHNYIVAWDPSLGLGKGHDPTAMVVLDRGDLTICLHCRRDDMGPEQFAREVVVPAAQYYNQALLVVEQNGQGGGAAIESCRYIYGDNMYMQKNLSKATTAYTDNLGWHTNEQSRYRMIDALRRALQEDKWTPCRDLLEEMRHMIARPIGDRKKVMHSDGYHDDLAMATGMALAVHFEEPIDEWPDWSKLRMHYGPKYSVQELVP